MMTMNDNQNADNTQASSDNEGIVYVLTNPAMPGLVKIGMTTRSDVTARINQLYTTGVPLPFDCEYAVTVKDVSQVEESLHFAFGDNRVNSNREFFEIDPARVKVILELLKIEDVTPGVDQEVKESTDVADKAASDKYKGNRPALVLEWLGVLENEEIEFVRSDETAKFLGDGNRVSYQGKEHSISGLTAVLLGRKGWVRPHRHWTYNGTLLQDLYNEWLASSGANSTVALSNEWWQVFVRIFQVVELQHIHLGVVS